MTFICYPKCTTCQRARTWLDKNQIAYTFRDIKTERPDYDELAEWYKRSGLPLKRFFNTSGLLYKSMELKDKLPGMRPLLIGDDFVLVGFKEAEWENRLNSK